VRKARELPDFETRMRIQRALARAGVASRRGAEELVAAGRVTVDGTVAQIGQTVDVAHDTICVDGKPIAAAQGAVWIVLNKPAGVLTTRSDPKGRPTVFDLVDNVPGLTYVGRLDYMTEGVLLLTTDGAAAHALTHPSREVERTYTAIVRGDAVAAARQARDGVMLDDGPVYPRQVEVRKLPGRGQYEFVVTLIEGRNREVRRLCEALGVTVERLVRTAFGPVRLGVLASGETRSLTRREKDVIAALGRA
jgi:23S rRNA pseudouridine2605 synthase